MQKKINFDVTNHSGTSCSAATDWLMGFTKQSELHALISFEIMGFAKQSGTCFKFNMRYSFDRSPNLVKWGRAWKITTSWRQAHCTCLANAMGSAWGLMM